MTSGKNSNQATSETPIQRAREKLGNSLALTLMLFMLGELTHWLRVIGVSDLFAIGTVIFVPCGILSGLFAIYWLLQVSYLSWKKE